MNLDVCDHGGEWGACSFSSHHAYAHRSHPTIYPSIHPSPTNTNNNTTQATFTFNFAEVYWNSRLQTEHARLIQRILDWKTSSGEPIAVVCKCCSFCSVALRTHAPSRFPSCHRRPATHPTNRTDQSTTITQIGDMFAGVGPFAVPLAMKGCMVHANDLNPRSHHFLEGNIKGNKVGPFLYCIVHFTARASVCVILTRARTTSWRGICARAPSFALQLS